MSESKDPDKIIVCAPKGTPASIPGTPAAFTKCSACGLDLVYDARNKPRIKELGLKPYCGDCAADLVLRSGIPNVGLVVGMTAGKESGDGVEEFLGKLKDEARRKPN